MVINVVSFDFFFIVLCGMFVVLDVQYLLIFVVMLMVGLVIGNFIVGVCYQVCVVCYWEQCICYLYEMFKVLVVGCSEYDIVVISEWFIVLMFQVCS